MKRIRYSWLAVAAFGTTLACSSTKPPLPPPPDGTGVQLEMLSSLDAGQEIERCKFFLAPPEGMWVNHSSVRYSAGSHHVLLFTTPYRDTIPTVDRNGITHDTSGIFDCKDGAPADWEIDGVAGGAQSSDAPDVIDLPPTVAVKIPPNAVLLMNTHYLNASPKGRDTDARINLYTIPESQVTDEAGVMFFYNPFIRVPGLGTASARMRCPVNRDLTLMNAQSHMHARGIGQVSNITDASGTMIEEVYRSSDWQNIYVKLYGDQGKQLKAGTAIDYRCNYDNKEARVVTQGLTTKDEMCMFVGAYYPRDRAFEICATDENSPAASAATFIGSGTNDCLSTRCSN
jgi:hypothetical protein